MRSSRSCCWLFLLSFATLATSCSYVHFGRPERFKTDAKLTAENADLRLEKKLLQQELALARKEGEALRAAIDRPGAAPEELVTQLTETTRELAALRVSYAQLKAERERIQAASAGGATAASAADVAQLASLQTRLGETENRLADTLRTFTTLQEENARLRTSIDEVRAENAQLTTRVEHVTAQNNEARSALAELSTELLAQKTARAEAEQQTEALRAQLVAMAQATPRDETPSLAAARESSATGAREMEATLRSSLSADSSVGAMLSIDSARLRSAAGAATTPIDAPAPGTEPAPSPAAPADSTPPSEPAPVATPTPVAASAQTYVVQPGDTLEKIARKVYGRPDRWSLLYSANNALLSGDRPLQPGMELVIPKE